MRKPVFESFERKATPLLQGHAPPIIDGKLDDPCWDDAIKVSQFFLNGSTQQAKEATKAYLLYDEDFIYVAFVCSESKIDNLVAHCTKVNSNVFDDDSVIIYLTSSHRDENYHYDGYYYYMAVNPKGTLLDAYYDPYEEGYFFTSWKSGCRIGTTIQRNAWIVELAIPFANLDISSDAGALWSLNLHRRRPAKGNMRSEFSSAPLTLLITSAKAVKRTSLVLQCDIRHNPLSEYIPQQVQVANLGITVVRTESEPKIDGKMSGRFWDKAAIIHNLSNNEDGSLAEQPTEVRLLYDDNYFYLSFLCFESMIDELKAAERKHDGKVTFDDCVIVYLMPYYKGKDDYHSGYYFLAVNPKGILLDAYYDSYGIFHPSWESGAKIGTSVGKKTWIVELAIPFSSLNLESDVSTTWKINLHRLRPKKSNSTPSSVTCSLIETAPFVIASMKGGDEISSLYPTYGHIRNPNRFGQIDGLNVDFTKILLSNLRDKLEYLKAKLIKLKKKAGNNKEKHRYINSAESELSTLKKEIYSQDKGKLKSIEKNIQKLDAGISLLERRISYNPVKGLSGEDKCLHDVFFVGNKGWAVGSLGTILYTPDAGKTWLVQQSNTDYELEGIFFVDEKCGWAVGGKVRDMNRPDFTNYLKIMDFDIGAMGIVIHTEDGGKNWSVQFEGDGRWLYDVHFVDKTHGWALGGYGVILYTEDGGESWLLRPNTNTHKWLYSIHFADKYRGWAVGEDEVILHTKDGGKSWILQEGIPLNRPFGWKCYYKDVYFTDLNNGWIVGRNGTILHTEDGGSSWMPQHWGLSDDLKELMDLESVYFVDKDNGWAVGYLGTLVLHTSNRGKTWNYSITESRPWLHSVYFVDKNRGYAVGERGTIIHTTNGGENWSIQRNKGNKCSIMVFHAHSDDEILRVGIPLAFYLDKGYTAACIRTTRDDQNTYRFGSLRNQEHRYSNAILGVHVSRTFKEFDTGGSDPDYVNYAHKIWHGTIPMEMRMVEAIRTWRPEVIITHEPVYGEYNKMGHKMTGRIATLAFDSAGDPEAFPGLSQIGLEACQPKKLYYFSGGEHSETINHLSVVGKYSKRQADVIGTIPPFSKIAELVNLPLYKLAYQMSRVGLRGSTLLKRLTFKLSGMTYGKIALQALRICQSQGAGRSSFPREGSLHLKKSKVYVPKVEKSIFDGIEN